MGYGFAGSLSFIPESLDFKTVKKWIYIGKHLVRENLDKQFKKNDPQLPQ
jgi:hypothetical protein